MKQTLRFLTVLLAAPFVVAGVVAAFVFAFFMSGALLVQYFLEWVE